MRQLAPWIVLAALLGGVAYAQSAPREGTWARTGAILLKPIEGLDDDAPRPAAAAPQKAASGTVPASSMSAALGTLARMGVPGEVATTPDGQRLQVTMADEFGVPNALFRVDIPRTCPANVTPQMLQADPGLATFCAAERLRASGRYEYVEFVIVAPPD